MEIWASMGMRLLPKDDVSEGSTEKSADPFLLRQREVRRNGRKSKRQKETRDTELSSVYNKNAQNALSYTKTRRCLYRTARSERDARLVNESCTPGRIMPFFTLVGHCRIQFLNFFPVDDIKQSLDVGGAEIPVLQVIGVLPDINR